MPIPDGGAGRGHQRPPEEGRERRHDQHTKPTRALAGNASIACAPSSGPITRSPIRDQQLPYLREWRDMYEGRAAVVLRPGSTDGSVEDPGARPRAPHPGGAAGRQYRPGRRADADARRDAALGRPPRRACARSMPQGYTMTVETGLTLAEVQAVADKRQPAVSAQPAVGGQLPARRQPRHQRRRRRRAGLRQHAPAGAGPRGGAGRRAHLERPQGA